MHRFHRVELDVVCLEPVAADVCQRLEVGSVGCRQREIVGVCASEDHCAVQPGVQVWVDLSHGRRVLDQSSQSDSSAALLQEAQQGIVHNEPQGGSIDFTLVQSCRRPVGLGEPVCRQDLRGSAGVDVAQHADVLLRHSDAAERVLQRGERYRVVCSAHVQGEQVNGTPRRATCFA
jgi:hypothetical protein